MQQQQAGKKIRRVLLERIDCWPFMHDKGREAIYHLGQWLSLQAIIIEKTAHWGGVDWSL
jgi:hypothetical protein